jgi:hypothetical protein
MYQRISGFAILVLVLVSATPAVAGEDWTGKNVVLKGGKPVKIVPTIDGGPATAVATLKQMTYKVLKEEKGRLKVSSDQGKEGWFDKDDAVVVDDAVA